jgi:hypothetical protein
MPPIPPMPPPGAAPQGVGATGNPAFCTFWTLSGLPALNLPLIDSAAGRDEALLRLWNSGARPLGSNRGNTSRCVVCHGWAGAEPLYSRT